MPLATRSCAVCDTAFEYMDAPSNRKAGRGKFCSRKCQYAGRKLRSDSILRRPQVCKHCGKVFIDNQGRVRVYCSNQCHGKHDRKGKTNHPRKKLGAELFQWTREVILRDMACVRCGATEMLQAHHIKPFHSHPKERLNVDNGATLCAYCHHAQHPEQPLESFLVRGGGKRIARCVVCEAAYLPHKSTQRACSPECGHKLRCARKQ